MEFDPVATRNTCAGWTAEKQVDFLRHLSATGSVTQSAALVGMTARSVYYLRNRPEADSFRAAWRMALEMAGDALLGLAYERAVTGSVQKYYQKGELIGERLVPSDRMLLWLLGNHRPRAVPSEKCNRPPVTPHMSAELVHKFCDLKSFEPTPQDCEEHSRRALESSPLPRPAARARGKAATPALACARESC